MLQNHLEIVVKLLSIKNYFAKFIISANNIKIKIKKQFESVLGPFAKPVKCDVYGGLKPSAIKKTKMTTTLMILFDILCGITHASTEMYRMCLNQTNQAM